VKQVETIISGAKLDEVRASLGRAGVEGMTVSVVRGSGKAHSEVYRSAEHEILLVPRLKVEIVVEDGRVPALIEELVRAVRSGRLDDGKIFVLPVDEAIRIRTNERGRDAL
jgi:nitrogen regulatory protein P-II 1